MQYLAALFAHDANADISSLDHGHIIGPITNAQHLARQAAVLPVQPLLNALGTPLSPHHLHSTAVLAASF